MLAACVAILVSMGLRQTFGLFFQAFEEGLGVTRTEFGLAIGIQMIFWGIFAPIFGLLAAFGYLFPNTELMLLFPPIPIKAKYFVIGYAVLELYLGVSNNPSDNVAHFAHLGGMLFGYLLLKYWQKNHTQFY